MTNTLETLAERIEREAVRIARGIVHPQGVHRVNAATAADCFAVAAALRAIAQLEKK